MSTRNQTALNESLFNVRSSQLRPRREHCALSASNDLDEPIHLLEDPLRALLTREPLRALKRLVPLESLRTNSPLRPVTPGTFSEATYANASQMLGGQPLRAGDEIGGFWLGSTIVLVFEAPKSWHWDIQNGQKLQVGQQLGHLE